MPAAISMWINLAMAALGGVAAVTPTAVSGSGSTVVSAAGAGAAILGIVNAYLHSISTAAPGPLAKS